jgi:glyoxylase-like metal-dependent hydrolase (beta-lactamase superfamily II)
VATDAELVHATGARRTRFGEEPRYPEGLYQVAEDVFAWLVPNGSWGETNSGLVRGEGSSLLVDTLWDLACTDQLLEALTPFVEDAPIDVVVNTHSDGDHFWGNQRLPGREIVATEACRAMMGHLAPRALSAYGGLGRALTWLPHTGCRQVGSWFAGMVRPYDFSQVVLTPATRTFTGELTLDVGGREVVLLEKGPAHTSGDALVLVPDARVVFTGDLLFVGGTPPLWAGPVENWLRALDAVIELEPEVVVPGHGPLTDRAGVQRMKDYWECVLTGVTDRHAAGAPPAVIARELLASPEFAAGGFLEWDSPERVFLSTHVLCRHLDGDGATMFSTPQVLRILAGQARVAAEHPEWLPAAMHGGAA